MTKLSMGKKRKLQDIFIRAPYIASTTSVDVLTQPPVANLPTADKITLNFNEYQETSNVDYVLGN